MPVARSPKELSLSLAAPSVPTRVAPPGPASQTGRYSPRGAARVGEHEEAAAESTRKEVRTMIETHDDAVDLATQAAMLAVLEFKLVELQKRHERLRRRVAEAVRLLGRAVLEEEN